jgi:hypothetical protein
MDTTPASSSDETIQSPNDNDDDDDDDNDWEEDDDDDDWEDGKEDDTASEASLMTSDDIEVFKICDGGGSYC